MRISTTTALVSCVFALSWNCIAQNGENGLRITKAVCGAEGSWRDVTAFLQGKVTGNSLSVDISQPFTSIGGDPASGKGKQMVIQYRYGGKDYTLNLSEAYPVAFQIRLPSAQALAGQTPATPTTIQDNGQPLEIVRAAYGAKDSWVDVTEKLRGMVRNNTLSVKSGSHLAGHDPLSGVVKELRITYRKNGQERTVSVREGSAATIPSETLPSAESMPAPVAEIPTEPMVNASVVPSPRVQPQASDTTPTGLPSVKDDAGQSSLPSPPSKPSITVVGINDAAKAGDVAKVEALLKADPFLINARDSLGGTPLHLAAVAGRLEVVKFLLARRANVNARTESGVTALHSAAFGGASAVVKLLLEAGASIDAKATNGSTPLDVAIAKNNNEAADVLRAAGAHEGAEAQERQAAAKQRAAEAQARAPTIGDGNADAHRLFAIWNEGSLSANSLQWDFKPGQRVPIIGTVEVEERPATQVIHSTTKVAPTLTMFPAVRTRLVPKQPARGCTFQLDVGGSFSTHTIHAKKHGASVSIPRFPPDGAKEGEPITFFGCTLKSEGQIPDVYVAVKLGNRLHVNAIGTLLPNQDKHVSAWHYSFRGEASESYAFYVFSGSQEVIVTGK